MKALSIASLVLGILALSGGFNFFFGFIFGVPALLFGCIVIYNNRKELHGRLNYILAGIGTLFGLFGVSSLFYVIWPPDVYTGREKVVAHAKALTGDEFSVVEYWGFDLYTVIFRHKLPNGHWRVYVIDGDAGKWWSCRLKIDEQSSQVMVGHILAIEGRNYQCSYNWKQNQFSRGGHLYAQAPEENIPSGPDPKSPMGRGAFTNSPPGYQWGAPNAGSKAQ